MANLNQVRIAVPLLLLLTALLSVPAFSQQGAAVERGLQAGTGAGVEQVLTQSTDFAGEWVVRNWEDRLERSNGPMLGDYLGMPLNAAGRMRAETFDAGEWSVLDLQCRPHPGPYQWRAQGAMRIVKEIDPVSRELVAYHFAFVRSLDRAVYLDGRPHPPEYAPHTWSGFSTAKFDGNDLVITTTHLKESYFRRNGPTFSDEAKITEWLTRHGEYLTITTYYEDPIYLEEPFIQSVTYQWEPHTELEYFPCTIVHENISDNVPHFLPGKNPWLKEFAQTEKLHNEATRGGAETMYPEYRQKLKNMKASN